VAFEMEHADDDVEAYSKAIDSVEHHFQEDI